MSRTLALAVLSLAPLTWAQEPAPNGHPEDPYGRSTPRGAVLGFLRATARDDFAAATRYLDTRLKGRAAEELAEQLGVVLNRRLLVPVEKISDEPGGTASAGEDPSLERIGSVQGPQGQVSIYLRRSAAAGQPPVWRFSPGTLANIPAVYADLEGSWFERNLPYALTHTKLLRVPLWRWLFVLATIPLAFLAAAFCGRLAGSLIPPLLRSLRLPAAGAEAFEIGGPFRVLAFAFFVYAQSWFSLSVVGRSFYETSGGVLSVIGFTWLLLRLLGGAFYVYENRRPSSNGGDLAIRRLFQRLLKVLVCVGGVIALVQTFGRDPTTLIAGLGVGGIAIAFAAQKTLENFFGGVMMISDRPVRVGDFCKVGDVMGTVEDIGLRSTRIRTLNRTLVSIPNGQISSENVENFAVRDKFLFRHTLGLEYGTTAAQMHAVLLGVRELLATHPQVEADGARIRFVAFNAYSLDLEIFAFVRATEMPAFLAIQEELLLRIMEIVEKSGTGFAFPSQTIYLRREG
jgi:MscS family membrane protein